MIYEPGQLLAAIGGSMGLFLGLSCFTIFRVGIDLVFGTVGKCLDGKTTTTTTTTTMEKRNNNNRTIMGKCLTLGNKVQEYC